MYTTLPPSNKIIQGLTCDGDYHDMHCNLQLVVEISEGGTECTAPVGRLKSVME